jgi:hypothetical protein
MSTFLNDLIESLEREAEETRAHLGTYPPRQPKRTIVEQNLKRIEQRLVTLRELRLAERNRKKGPDSRQSSSVADKVSRHTRTRTANYPDRSSVPEMYET